MLRVVYQTLVIPGEGSLINIREAINFIKLRKTVTLLLTYILSHHNAICNVLYRKLYLFTNLCNIYYIST